MAEQQKTTSSAVVSKSKEKRSELDEEIGKDFLSSWKSMDDAMDFSFETISKGKKKAFNFDKLDMDFNLDGDFDKLSSIKIDMPDLDFSSPPRKDAKAKEKSKEETKSGKHQEKKDCFTFSFDFNELDDFDFDSSLKKGEKTCKKSQEKEAVSSESSEDSKIVLALEDDCITAKFPASKNATNSKAEKTKGGAEACNSLDDPSPSKVSLQELVSGDLVADQGSKVSPEKTVDTIAQETNKSSPLSDRVGCSELHELKFLPSSPMDALSENHSNQETVSNIRTEVCSQGRRINTIQSSPMDSFSENNSNQEAVFNMQAEVCSQRKRLDTTSAVEDDASDKNITKEESIHEKLQRKNSFPLSQSDRDERKGAGGSTLEEIDYSQSAHGDKDISTASLSREILDNSGAKNSIQRSAQDDIALKDVSTEGLSREMLHKNAAENIQNPTPKLPLVSLDRCSEPTVSELTARKDKEAVVIHSRFFTRSEETKSQLHPTSATGKEVSSFSSKKIGDMQICPAKEKREDISGNEGQNESKLIGYSKLSSQELTKGKPLLLQKKNNIGSAGDIRDGFNAGAVQNGGSKLICKLRVQDTAVTKGEPVLLGSEKNASLIANPSKYIEKKTESGSQTSVNPKLQVPKVESSQNSKFLSEALKIAKKAPALSGSPSRRIIGPNKDQPDPQRETNSFKNLEQSKDMPGNTSGTVLPVRNAEKLTPKLPSLKRKTFEESNGDLLMLKPLKRVLPSPSESSCRNLKESSERVANEEVQNNKKHMEDSTKNILFDHLTSGSEVPGEVNMTELEFPLVEESHENVEKAEAYGKELEDICNMLKKKHEEAKELMVRAVVNNNNLLMLNHPMFQVKVNMVKKFAELLISKEMAT